MRMFHDVLLSLLSQARGLPLATMPAGLLLVALTGPARAADDRWVLLDGSYTEATTLDIDESGKVRAAGDTVAPVDLQALRRIERPGAVESFPRPQAVVYLAGGGVIAARNLTVDDRGLVVDLSWAKGVVLPLEMARGILLTVPAGERVPAAATDLAQLKDDFAKALKASEPVKTDTLFALADGKLQPVPGVLKAIDDQNVTFLWADKLRTVARAKVHGIAMAPVGAAAERVGLCLVHTRDGSALWGRLLKLEGDALSLRLAGLTGNGAALPTLTVPWPDVARIDVRSERMVFLSGVTPLEVVEESLLALPAPWRRNQSAGGGPLLLGDQTFESGLGVHARCLLTYDAGRRFDVFAATIGIDALTLPRDKGDCEFLVLGDGRELFRARVRRADAPRPISVKITGVQRVTLAVEPGVDLDLADYADWCDARFVREGK